MHCKYIILIVTYNAMPWLPLCCHPADELPEGWGIVVVDNASTDGTADELEKNYPHITLIRSRENLGFGRANNLGMRHALDQGAEYLYLMNQDSSIPVQGLEDLVRLHKKHPECLIVSPVQKNGDGSDLDYSFADFCAASGLDCLTREQDAPEIIFADWGIAAGWLLPRQTLLQIGGFNPLFLHYGEDEDYVNRVLFHGGKIGIAAKVVMRHHRIEKKNRKPFADRFIDRLITMTDPNRQATSPARVLRSFSGPVAERLMAGDIRKTVFLVRACRELMRGDTPGSLRDKVKYRGGTFL